MSTPADPERVAALLREHAALSSDDATLRTLRIQADRALSDLGGTPPAASGGGSADELRSALARVDELRRVLGDKEHEHAQLGSDIAAAEAAGKKRLVIAGVVLLLVLVLLVVLL